MRVNATASISKSIIDALTINDLERHFVNFSVSLRGIKYETQQIVLSLNGTKDDLRTAVKALYVSANKVFNGVETNAAKFVPENLRTYLCKLENESSYQKDFDHQADEYMKQCALNNVMPHPEVMEDFVY